LVGYFREMSLPPEIQVIVQQFLQDYKEKQSRMRLPIMVTIDECLEILGLLKKLRA